MLRIDVWSDVACPWCWVGKRHLEAALEGEPPAEVVWHAFELNPTAPPQLPNEVPYAVRLARKYGVSEDEGQAMIDRITGVGASVGLDFRFDRIRPTNTFDAHRLIHWAGVQGRQTELKERLMVAYMNEGRLLSDPEVLAAMAAEVGLDPQQARAILDSDTYAQHVRADEAAAGQLGITGVPFFVVAAKYGVSGAQPSEVLREVFKKAVAGADAVEPDEPAPGCDDGACAVPAKESSP